MDYYRLLDKLVRYGEVQICKAGYVFTVLITGSYLSSAEVVNNIQHAVISEVGEKYPVIECLKNGSNFFCMVLKPGTSTQVDSEEV